MPFQLNLVSLIDSNDSKSLLSGFIRHRDETLITEWWTIGKRNCVHIPQIFFLTNNCDTRLLFFFTSRHTLISLKMTKCFFPQCRASGSGEFPTNLFISFKHQTLLSWDNSSVVFVVMTVNTWRRETSGVRNQMEARTNLSRTLSGTGFSVTVYA